MPSGAPLDPLPSLPAPGVYRHYKGNHYEVLGLARHSEDLSPLVIYRRLDALGRPLDAELWARPHAMWSEPVDHEGRAVPRFAPVASAN
jgi:hypothetical protein